MTNYNIPIIEISSTTLIPKIQVGAITFFPVQQQYITFQYIFLNDSLINYLYSLQPYLFNQSLYKYTTDNEQQQYRQIKFKVVEDIEIIMNLELQNKNTFIFEQQYFIRSCDNQLIINNSKPAQKYKYSITSEHSNLRDSKTQKVVNYLKKKENGQQSFLLNIQIYHKMIFSEKFKFHKGTVSKLLSRYKKEKNLDNNYQNCGVWFSGKSYFYLDKQQDLSMCEVQYPSMAELIYIFMTLQLTARNTQNLQRNINYQPQNFIITEEKLEFNQMGLVSYSIILKRLFQKNIIEIILNPFWSSDLSSIELICGVIKNKCTMKIVFALLFCLILVQANEESSMCINNCIGNSCKGEQDQYKCLNLLSSEVKCLKVKCDPVYKADCLNSCCTSKTCKNLLSCAEKCPSSELADLYPFFQQQQGKFIIHDLTKNQDNQFELANATNPPRNSASTSSSNLLQVVSLLLGLSVIYG
ncbi:hypothetical protein ABPG72_012163 [Tetrahymena utriculariae]